jgi:RNA polymerase sigma-70 factor (ECF subfamily)
MATAAQAKLMAWRTRSGSPRQARSPDRTAATLEAVYREHVGPVYAFFACWVDRATAEDLTASTFERVVRSWSRFDPARASEQTWIFAIARNVLIDQTRRQRHRAGPSLNEHPEIIDRIARSEDPLAVALGAEAITEWLARLRPREREILVLRYCADVPVAELATWLGLSENNVHQICSRALRRLRAGVTEPVEMAAAGR